MRALLAIIGAMLLAACTAQAEVEERSVVPNDLPNQTNARSVDVAANNIPGGTSGTEVITTAVIRSPRPGEDVEDAPDPWLMAVEGLKRDRPVAVRAIGIEAINEFFEDELITVGPPACFGHPVPGGLVICRITRWSPYTYQGRTRTSGGAFGQTVVLPIGEDAVGEQVFTYRSHWHGGALSPPMTVKFDVEPGPVEIDPRMQFVADDYAESDHGRPTLIICNGIAQQGGLVICKAPPNAEVEVGRSETDTYKQSADDNGVLIIGFDRDEPDAFVRLADAPDARVDFDIAPRDYDISRIDGLPKNMVSSYTEEELARIRAATARKKVGFASKAEAIGFRDGFIYPVTEHRKTTNFGAQRVLNGEPKRPHFGVDLAAPKGTPILAPADGIVSLANDDMYFEGSLIMIDHGQGLISYYLHNEDILVEAGQRVSQGEQIGTVGSRGRSTGPHLCWRLKWRGRNLDPELLVNWQSEAKVHG